MSRIFFGFTFIISWFLCVVGTFNAQYLHVDQNAFGTDEYPNAASAPSTPHLPSSQALSPVEYMVDLSNDLAYRLLHFHSILNRNNFAFSPTALMSMLSAAYEGSTGRSASELRTVLWLPPDRDVIRIGYRDINRRLRTYFFGSENPLKGLTLNRGNVTVTRNYETVLKFYGYDLIEDMIPMTALPLTTTSPLLNTTKLNTVETGRDPSIQIDIVNMSSSTFAPLDDNLTEENPTTKATATETASTLTPRSTPTITPLKETAAFSVSPPTISTPLTRTLPTTTTTTPATEISLTQSSTLETLTAKPTTDLTEDDSSSIKQNKDDAVEVISSFLAEEAAAEPFLRIQKARVTQLIPSGRLQAPLHTPKGSYLPPNRRSAAVRRNLRRHKRHLFDIGYKNLDSGLLLTLLHPQIPTTFHYHQRLYPISEADSNALFTEAPRQDYDTDIISHVFYLNNQQTIHTTFKVYNAVLYHKHFEQLKISALELELNTAEYNLVILLPDFGTDLTTAAASLQLGPTLRLMRKQLKPRWVQAVIPDFSLHGTIFLTNDLQNMGICDIFEPNRADFRPMTDEKGVYIKHIEQSINVNIRTRPINQLKQSSSSQTPIQISVNHPFLFFIIDRDLDVAVMAGRILNPLNVRIQ